MEFDNASQAQKNSFRHCPLSFRLIYVRSIG